MAGLRGCAPLARFLTAFSRKKAVSPKADAFVTPPQSGSGCKEQSKSKAAKARPRRADALSYGC